MKLRLKLLKHQKDNILIKAMIVNSANLSNKKKKNPQSIKVKTPKQILLIKFFHTYTPVDPYQSLKNFFEEI